MCQQSVVSGSRAAGQTICMSEEHAPTVSGQWLTCNWSNKLRGQLTPVHSEMCWVVRF